MEATDAAVVIERSAVARFALEYWRAAAAAAAFDRRTAVLPLQINYDQGSLLGKTNMHEKNNTYINITRTTNTRIENIHFECCSMCT